MRQTDKEEKRNPDRGIGAGTAAITERQSDDDPDVPHMPRHWQGSGTRGQTAGQTPPGPDERDVARGNQFGRAGELAGDQVHKSLTEHGEQPAPQSRDNEQLPKRPGERPEDKPTPDKGG